MPFFVYAVIVASSGTDSSAFGGSGGIAGLGQSNAQNPTDTLINQYLTSNQTTLSQFIFGLALYDQSVNQASNGVALEGDSSGGFMHLDGPDPAFYTGTIQSFPVVSSEMSTNWGSVPGQLGSFDWTVQTQGWLVKTAAGDITGSQGMYGTMESSYPYLLLPQRDANKLCKWMVSLSPEALDFFVAHLSLANQMPQSRVQCPTSSQRTRPIPRVFRSTKITSRCRGRYLVTLPTSASSSTSKASACPSCLPIS